MTTAQDQQSRAEFEAFWRKEMNVQAMDLARTNYPMTPPEKQQYLCHETNRAWITWQAARALPAGVEPVYQVSRPCPAPINSSLMLDDGGERPTYCVMAAYLAEDDARTALAMLSSSKQEP